MLIYLATFRYRIQLIIVYDSKFKWTSMLHTFFLKLLLIYAFNKGNDKDDILLEIRKKTEINSLKRSWNAFNFRWMTCSAVYKITSFQLKKITVLRSIHKWFFAIYSQYQCFICFPRNTWFTHWIVMMGATFSVGISHEILWKWLTSSRCEIKLTSCWASCVLWCISHQKSYTTLVCRSVHFCVVNIKQRWQKSFMSIDFAKILPKNWNSLRLNWF